MFRLRIALLALLALLATPALADYAYAGCEPHCVAGVRGSPTP